MHVLLIEIGPGDPLMVDITKQVQTRLGVPAEDPGQALTVEIRKCEGLDCAQLFLLTSSGTKTFHNDPCRWTRHNKKR